MRSCYRPAYYGNELIVDTTAHKCLQVCFSGLDCGLQKTSIVPKYAMLNRLWEGAFIYIAKKHIL